MTDVLEMVNIRHDAYIRWNSLCSQLAPILEANGMTDFADEKVYVDDAGNLIVYVDLPDGARLQMAIEPHEWQWNGKQN